MPALYRLKDILTRYPQKLTLTHLARGAALSPSTLSRIINHNLWPRRREKADIMRRISLTLHAADILCGDEIWTLSPDADALFTCPTCNATSPRAHALGLCKRCYSRQHRLRLRAEHTSIGNLDLLEELNDLRKTLARATSRFDRVAGEVHRLNQDLDKRDATIAQLTAQHLTQERPQS